MGAQATGHKNTVEDHPDHSSGRRGDATQRSGEATWLRVNSLLFRHTLDYQRYMVQLINRSQEAIQALHECIWEVVHWVMESAGKSAADGLGVALHLVDMLPTIPLQLTFNTVTPGPLGHTPEALTYASQHSIDRGAMTVLSEELIREPPSAKDKAMQAVWHVTANRYWFHKDRNHRGAGDGNIDCSGSSPSLAPCTHPHPWTGALLSNGTKRSKMHSPNCSPFQNPIVPQAPDKDPIPLISMCRALTALLPTESASDTESSLDDSGGLRAIPP